MHRRHIQRRRAFAPPAGRRASRLLAGIIGLCLGAIAPHVPASGAKPPASPHVRDDARLFDAAVAERLNRKLADAYEATEVSILVACSSFLEGGNMREHAHTLVARWLKDQPGLLIAFNRGNSMPAIAASPEFWRRYPVDEVTQLFAAIGNILAVQPVPPEDRLLQAAELAVERVNRLEASRRLGQRFLTVADVRLAAFVGAALAAAGTAAWFLAHRRRQRRVAAGAMLVFPEVSVAPRLGAPFGGGAVGTSDARRTG